MEDQVEEVKNKTDIVGVVGQYVLLKKLGRHHKGLCPFHGEKTPSFMVNEELGLYKCFGCGAGGDVIKFLMEVEGIDFRDALGKLADKVGIKLKTFKRDDGEKQKLLEVMELAARYYHWLLTEGRSGMEARQYLEQRKINKKLIDTFNIGFALPGWDNLVKYLIDKKGYSKDLLEKAGLVGRKEQRVYDKFRGRIMFPLLDSGGKVVGFSGRILPSLDKENEPKYLNSPETELYHKGRTLFGFYQAKQAIRKNKRVVLVEGQMDMVSSFGAGVTETVAVGGTALTDGQVEMVARLAKTIYLSLDADEAGTIAVKRAVDIAEKRGLEIKIVQIIGGKDPDEIARKSPKKWKKLVEKAVDVYEFVLLKSIQNNNVSMVEGIKKVVEEVVPFLAKIENDVVREVWAKKLAEKLGVEVSGVKTEIEKYKSGKLQATVPKISKPVDEVKDNKKERLFKRLIGSLLAQPSVREKVGVWFKKTELTGGLGKALKWLLVNPKNDISEIMSEVPSELRDYIAESYMAEGEVEKTDEKGVIELSVALLRELVRDKKQLLMIDMEKARKLNDDQKEEELFSKLNDLNREESKILSYLG